MGPSCQLHFERGLVDNCNLDGVGLTTALWRAARRVVVDQCTLGGASLTIGIWKGLVDNCIWMGSS